MVAIITKISIFGKFDIIFKFENIRCMGDKMKVKVFDESHEKDLENSINGFLNSGEFDIIDIKYQVAIAVCGEDQIYCFSALIIYN